VGQAVVQQTYCRKPRSGIDNFYILTCLLNSKSLTSDDFFHVFPGALHLNSGRTSDQKEHELPSTFQDCSTGGSLPSPDQNTGRESWGWNAPTEYGIQPGGESEDQNSAKEFQSMSPKESKGRFYEQYREKRDAKLREELGSKKAEREAKLKSMQEVLERRKAEMAARSGRLSEKYAVLGIEKGDVLIKSKSQKVYGRCPLIYCYLVATQATVLLWQCAPVCYGVWIAYLWLYNTCVARMCSL